MNRGVLAGAGWNSLFSSFLSACEGEEHCVKKKPKGVKRSQLLMVSPFVINLFLSGAHNLE